MAMFGLQLTGVNDLDNIYLEAREGCSDMKKIYAWGLVITAVYWVSRNIKVFEKIVDGCSGG
jgi:hypothetical protein